LLSDLSNFRDGKTLVQEQEGLRSDIFRSYTTAKDTRGVIRALKKYGPEEPQLYVDALTYFASSSEALQEAGDELNAVLRRIDQEGLMAPLQVIQALSKNAVVTMGMVKSYLSDNIERERKEISSVREDLLKSFDMTD
jgi:vacuolar protein sorting-associated protein 11